MVKVKEDLVEKYKSLYEDTMKVDEYKEFCKEKGISYLR